MHAFQSAAGQDIILPWPRITMQATVAAPGSTQLETFELPFSTLGRDGLPFVVSPAGVVCVQWCMHVCMLCILYVL